MCLKGKSRTEDDMLSLLTQKPKSLVCYICGREFGTTSLEIHLKTCKKKWDWEQDQKPPEERRPLPEPPEDFEAIMAGNYDDSMMEKYNQAAFDNYNFKALEKCTGCGRTFNLEALAKHQKHCLKDKKKSESPPQLTPAQV